MRMSIVRALAATLAAAALLGPVPQGQAVDLPTGSLVTLNGTTYAARPELGGVVQQDHLIPFTITDANGTAVFSGTVQDRVARSTLTGTLHFYFLIRDTDPTLSGSIVMVARTGFGTGATDVDYRTDGLGNIGPDLAFRVFGPDEVDFDFWDNPIPPGYESLFTFVLTGATSFNQSGTLTLYTDDGSSVTLTCAAPN